MESIFNKDIFQNKTILVLGASSGMGKDIALKCSEHGAKVFGLGRDEANLSKTVKEGKGNITAFKCNLTNSENIDSFIRENKNVKFDAIIQAAGISSTFPFRYSDRDKMTEILLNNAIGPLSLIQQLYKSKMINSNSSIVFISSVMAEVGEMGKSLYAMSKGAIHSAVKSLAIEFSSKKIRVNSISPGVVKTPLSAISPYFKDEQSLQKVIDLHPLGIGEIKDITPLVLFLISDSASWITGADLKIDGGYSAR